MKRRMFFEAIGAALAVCGIGAAAVKGTEKQELPHWQTRLVSPETEGKLTHVTLHQLHKEGVNWVYGHDRPRYRGTLLLGGEGLMPRKLRQLVPGDTVRVSEAPILDLGEEGALFWVREVTRYQRRFPSWEIKLDELWDVSKPKWLRGTE